MLNMNTDAVAHAYNDVCVLSALWCAQPGWKPSSSQLNHKAGKKGRDAPTAGATAPAPVAPAAAGGWHKPAADVGRSDQGQVEGDEEEEDLLAMADDSNDSDWELGGSKKRPKSHSGNTGSKAGKGAAAARAAGSKSGKDKGAGQQPAQALRGSAVAAGLKQAAAAKAAGHASKAGSANARKLKGSAVAKGTAAVKAAAAGNVTTKAGSMAKPGTVSTTTAAAHKKRKGSHAAVGTKPDAAGNTAAAAGTSSAAGASAPPVGGSTASHRANRGFSDEAAALALEQGIRMLAVAGRKKGRLRELAGLRLNAPTAPVQVPPGLERFLDLRSPQDVSPPVSEHLGSVPPKSANKAASDAMAGTAGGRKGRGRQQQQHGSVQETPAREEAEEEEEEEDAVAGPGPGSTRAAAAARHADGTRSSKRPAAATAAGSSRTAGNGGSSVSRDVVTGSKRKRSEADLDAAGDGEEAGEEAVAGGWKATGPRTAHTSRAGAGAAHGSHAARSSRAAAGGLSNRGARSGQKTLWQRIVYGLGLSSDADGGEEQGEEEEEEEEGVGPRGARLPNGTGTGGRSSRKAKRARHAGSPPNGRKAEEEEGEGEGQQGGAYSPPAFQTGPRSPRKRRAGGPSSLPAAAAALAKPVRAGRSVEPGARPGSAHAEEDEGEEGPATGKGPAANGKMARSHGSKQGGKSTGGTAHAVPAKGAQKKAATRR